MLTLGTKHAIVCVCVCVYILGIMQMNRCCCAGRRDYHIYVRITETGLVSPLRFAMTKKKHTHTHWIILHAAHHMQGVPPLVCFVRTCTLIWAFSLLRSTTFSFVFDCDASTADYVNELSARSRIAYEQSISAHASNSHDELGNRAQCSIGWSDCG